MTLLEKGFAAVAKGLTEFGYSGITADTVRTAHERWKRGEKPQGVIEMFAVRDFDQRPEIFGAKD